MLILTRRVGETLTVEAPTGQTIRVAVIIGSKGNHVRLGIEAPAEVAVVREELLKLSGTNSSSSTLDLAINPQTMAG